MRLGIWLLILGFWYVVARGYIMHGDVVRNQAILSGPGARIIYKTFLYIYCIYIVILIY